MGWSLAHGGGFGDESARSLARPGSCRTACVSSGFLVVVGGRLRDGCLRVGVPVRALLMYGDCGLRECEKLLIVMPFVVVISALVVGLGKTAPIGYRANKVACRYRGSWL